MLESMLKIKYIVPFGFFKGRLKCSNTDVHYEYMQSAYQDHGRVWLCLAAHCSQDAFSFLTLSLFLPKRVWSSSDIFCETPTFNMLYLKVMYSWNVEMTLQSFVLFLYILVMHLEFLEQLANRVALCDAAWVRCSNVTVHKGATVSSPKQKWVIKPS